MTQQDPYGNQPYDPYGGEQPQQYNVDPPAPYGTPQSPQPDGYYQQPQSPQSDGYYQQQPTQYDPRQYTAPPYGAPMSAAPAPQNGLGIAALVLGIVAIVLSPCCYMIFTAPTGILAVIFGSIGMSKAARGEATNKGMAMAGLICGGVGLALGILMVVLTIVVGAFDYNYTYTP